MDNNIRSNIGNGIDSGELHRELDLEQDVSHDIDGSGERELTPNEAAFGATDTEVETTALESHKTEETDEEPSLVGGSAELKGFTNSDGDSIDYHDSGDIVRQDADGEFFYREGATGDTYWSRDEDRDSVPEQIGQVGADGTTTTVISDIDGDGVPDEFTESDLADTEVSELENPDFLEAGLTEEAANAALAPEEDAALDEVQVLAEVGSDDAVLVNTDQDFIIRTRDEDDDPSNNDVYRENGNGQTYQRTDGVTSWASEGSFGTVNADGTTTTVELDTDDDGIPDLQVESSVPLAGTNVDELLDPRFLDDGIREGDIIVPASFIPYQPLEFSFSTP